MRSLEREQGRQLGSAGRDLGEIDPSSEQVMAAEGEYIARRRAYYGFRAQPERRTAALALSGGGIRSASFALGVMQRLAKDDYLRLFDYLSTVSGGGYIGCSITWLTSGTFRTTSGLDFGLHPGDAKSEPFPYGSDDPREPVRRHPPNNIDRFLTFLRSHGEYLIPGNKITLLSGIAVVLRGILVNLLVWYPIAVALSVLAALPLPFAAPAWLKVLPPLCSTRVRGRAVARHRLLVGFSRSRRSSIRFAAMPTAPPRASATARAGVRATTRDPSFCWLPDSRLSAPCRLSTN